MRTTFKAKVLNTECLQTNKASDGDWVEGFYYMYFEPLFNGSEYCECIGYEQDVIFDNEKEETYPVDILSLCQCIGLTDKKGRYIYIGDVLEDEQGKLMTIKEKVNGWGLYSNDTKREGTFNSIKKYKIIGNIND